MTKISGIYKIQSRCKPERIYVGSAVDITNRWRLHLWELGLNRHHSSKLQNHYNKYGADDLEFSIIELCHSSLLIAVEQTYIDKLAPFFNIALIAGSCLGIERTKEFKAGVSKAKGGVKKTEVHKRRIAASMTGDKNPMYGKPSPKKGKKGNPNPYKGIKGRYSEETLQKMRISNQRAWNRRRQAKKEMEEQLCHE